MSDQHYLDDLGEDVIVDDIIRPQTGMTREEARQFYGFVRVRPWLRSLDGAIAQYCTLKAAGHSFSLILNELHYGDASS